MAFDLNAAGGYGTGAVGDFNLDDLTPLAINWSATVSAMSNFLPAATTLTLSNIVIGSNGTTWTNIAFNVGTEVLIYVDGNATGGAANDDDAKTWIGRWLVAKITASTVTGSTGGTITVNKNLSVYNTVADEGCALMVTNIPHFQNLTLNAGSSIVPNSAGNPVVFKVSDTLTFNGGHINLSGYGHTSQLRPLLNQESNGTLDTDKYSGWENSATKDRFAINKGDGAAFIIANNITVANAGSRIGNPAAQGVQYCRGASDSYNVPSGVTNIGGSTILLVANTITDFTPKLIAKYRTGAANDGNGHGLCRCYIASNTRLTNDEGLYAYDNISNPSVVTDTLKIKSFGDGSNGASTSSMLWSNYAAVTAFSSNRKVLTVKNMTTNGAIAFESGTLVIVHAVNKDSTNTKNAGRFYLATVLGVNGNDITLDTAAAYNTFNNWIDTYYVQILTVPQFTNFRPSKDVGTQIPAFNDSNGYGGIFAVACNNTCDLSGRAVNVMGKGGGAAYGRNGLTHIGNAQDCGRLPIGQGHGSVFILAKNLVMNSATRIGATYSGAVSDGGDYGGDGGFTQKDTTSNTVKDTVNTAVNGGGYCGATGIATSVRKYHGGGGNGAEGGWGGGSSNQGEDRGSAYNGGYGANGLGAGGHVSNGLQGAHIMIIADTITGFNQAAISTGGKGCSTVIDRTSPTAVTSASYGASGSAGYGGGGSGSHSKNGMGYGGGGGYNGGGGGGICNGCDDSYGVGGGAAGWAFIYCNNVVNQDTTDTVID